MPGNKGSGMIVRVAIAGKGTGRTLEVRGIETGGGKEAYHSTGKGHVMRKKKIADCWLEKSLLLVLVVEGSPHCAQMPKKKTRTQEWKRKRKRMKFGDLGGSASQCVMSSEEYTS